MAKGKVLVTGGAGFIGSNLTERLVKEKYDVTVIDNLLTGREENLEGILSNINFIKGDIKNFQLMKKLSKGMDYIFHQAALTSVPRSIKDPESTTETNVQGTLNVLLAARDNKVKKVVYASSSSIYGEREGKEKKEFMKPQPLSPYAASKLMGEHLCKVFAHVYDLNTICLRYFNVFGPKQNPYSEYSAVIPKFIASIFENERPTIFGDGKQSRDFTYVDNVVQANILAALKPIKTGETFNIACNKSYDLLQIVNIINKTLNKNIKPILAQERSGDIKYSLANITKAKKLLGYRPEVNFEQGLEKTINWYKKYL